MTRNLETEVNSGSGIPFGFPQVAGRVVTCFLLGNPLVGSKKYDAIPGFNTKRNNDYDGDLDFLEDQPYFGGANRGAYLASFGLCLKYDKTLLKGEILTFTRNIQGSYFDNRREKHIENSGLVRVAVVADPSRVTWDHKDEDLAKRSLKNIALEGKEILQACNYDRSRIGFYTNIDFRNYWNKVFSLGRAAELSPRFAIEQIETEELAMCRQITTLLTFSLAWHLSRAKYPYFHNNKVYDLFFDDLGAELKDVQNFLRAQGNKEDK